MKALRRTSDSDSLWVDTDFPAPANERWRRGPAAGPPRADGADAAFLAACAELPVEELLLPGEDGSAAVLVFADLRWRPVLVDTQLPVDGAERTPRSATWIGLFFKRT